MIPKTIHYCWFGGNPKPRLAQKCIASWKKYCPDYRIIEWNEANFDVGQHPYMLWCQRNRKWAFLSDYARLLILKEHGGIYLDTDVEVLRPLDDLLSFEAFWGFQENTLVNTGLGFGCVAGHPLVEAMAKLYQELRPDEHGNYTLTPCPELNTPALTQYGLKLDGSRQRILGAEILPVDYLNPYDNPTGRLRKTSNTYSIHWYGKSWISKRKKLKSILMRPLHRVFGTDFVLFRLLRRRRR